MTQLTPAALETAFKTEELLQKAATKIANDIQVEKYDIAHLVEVLGFALTSTLVDVRVNGTKLLSSTLAQLPKAALTETQLEFIVTFYEDRLKDQHNVIPAVIDGIDALVTMQHLPRKSIPKLLHSFFQQTSCQSQVCNDRTKLFKIFKYLTEHYEAELISMSGDFIFGLINSIDGERDPRNLDFIFSFMPSVIARYPLLHLSEEMFEIFACYFPIDFNPSKTDPEAITRDHLADKLASCLVASPSFVEWTVALALEKLDTDLLTAKLDSLELLHRAALNFRPNLLEPHFEEIWTALKKEVFPGSDNADVVSAGLRTLRTILEQAADATTADSPSLSQNYQTIVLGTILPHLSDVNQKLFNSSTAIALVCVSGDAAFATERILNCFLLKLRSQSTSAGEESKNNEERLKMYTIISQVFKITALRNELTPLKTSAVCTSIHEDLINYLRREGSVSNLDIKRAALAVLNECVPTISEVNRALIYQTLVTFITSDTLDLEFRFLLEQLGALHPIELQAHCIDICIKNFHTYSTNAKRKIYANLLPLIKQVAFTQLVLDLIFSNIFTASAEVVCQLALAALNELLTKEDKHFVEELQNNNCLIAKLIQLMQGAKLESDTLEQAAAALSQIVRQLPLAEQYMVATEHLPLLHLQLECDLYVAQGLLGFLHPDLSLADHFERLVTDLTELSLNSENEKLRQVAHHLLCSLVNKIDNNEKNQKVIRNLISNLKQELQQGRERAVEVLSWLGKALIVRDGGEAVEIVENLVELLDHPTLSTAAQLAFEIISTEYPQLHLPIVKYLFKQKYFHLLLSKLGHRLESYCEHHLNAFIYVMQATPHAVLKLNIARVGPILFKCLESTRTHTLCISLKICENFIRQNDEYFRSHLNHIVPCCLHLSQFQASMRVRIAALQLLHDITKYPTYVLLPFQMDVVLELAKAVDDRKRLVRTAAVTARNAWFLVGAPTSED